jgi:hypothetical protein
MGRGSTNQTELSPSMIGEAEIALPKSIVMDEFQSMAGPIYDQVTNLTLQVEKLKPPATCYCRAS